MDLFSVGCCPECGSLEITWHSDAKNNGSSQDGLIKMDEVTPIFFLGCNECSKTINVVTGDDVAVILSKFHSASWR